MDSTKLYALLVLIVFIVYNDKAKVGAMTKPPESPNNAPNELTRKLSMTKDDIRATTTRKLTEYSMHPSMSLGRELKRIIFYRDGWRVEKIDKMFRKEFSSAQECGEACDEYPIYKAASYKKDKRYCYCSKSVKRVRDQNQTYIRITAW